MRNKIYILLLVLGYVFYGFRYAYAEKPVGMILDCQGLCTILHKDKLIKANVIMTLYEGDKVFTGKNGKVVFVWYANNKEYTVYPKSEVHLTPKGVTTSVGKAYQKGKKDLPLPKNLVVKSRRILGQVVRMVGGNVINILSPTRNQTLDTLTPTFRWVGGSTPKVEITLREKGKKTPKFCIVTLDNGKYTYKNDPDSKFKLEYGKEYCLEISPEGRLELKDKMEKDMFMGPPKGSSVNFKILSLEQIKKIREAEKTFRKMVRKNPKNKKAYFLMADLYRQHGLYNKAIPLAEKLLKIDKENPYAYYYLANLYSKEGESIKAIDLMQRGKSLEKKIKRSIEE